MQLQKFRKLISVIRNPFYRKAFIRQWVAASVEHDVLLRQIGEKIECVFDIGANRGQFALAARNNFPTAKIFCFEPLTEPVNVLKKVFENDSLVTINEMAIGETNAHATMHVSKQDDSSSLLPISSMQSTIYPGTEEKETRSVQVKPLDAVISSSEIEQPAFLKIDVQGFEMEVLRGCVTLLPFFSYVYVECSFVPLYSGQKLAHEIIIFLNEHGFILSGIYNLSYDKSGVAVQGDFLFTKTDSNLNT